MVPAKDPCAAAPVTAPEIAKPVEAETVGMLVEQEQQQQQQAPMVVVSIEQANV